MVLSAGITGDFDGGWFVNMRLRHFGAYPLIENNSVESDGSSLVNLRLGRHWQRTTVMLDILNALDSDDHDIDYYYASRLSGEAASGVDDVHFHSVEPRGVRLSLGYRF